MEKKNKTQPITKDELHKALGEYNRAIVEAIDKRFDGIETDIVIIKTEMEDLHGDVRRIDQRTDKTFSLLEGYIKAQEDFRQDFLIMQHEINEIKKVLKVKLGVEIN